MRHVAALLVLVAAAFAGTAAAADEARFRAGPGAASLPSGATGLYELGTVGLGQASAQGGLGQGPVEHVALGMASTKDIDDMSGRPESLGRGGMVAPAEGAEALDQRPACPENPVRGFAAIRRRHVR